MVSLNLCHNSDHDTLERVVGLCRETGCGIELSDFCRVETFDDPAGLTTISRLIRDIPERALHAPYLYLDPVSLDPAVRERTLDLYNRAYETAVRLGVRHITYHSIYDPAQYSFDHWYQGLVSFWRGFMTGKESGIRVHIENVLDREPQVLLDMLDDIGCSDLDINLDIGHAHAYSGRPVGDWIETLGNRIGYTHLHDNDGQTDRHIGLGLGTIPVPDVFRLMNRHAPEAVWAIESGGDGMIQSLKWLQDNGLL